MSPYADADPFDLTCEPDCAVEPDPDEFVPPKFPVPGERDLATPLAIFAADGLSVDLLDADAALERWQSKNRKRRPGIGARLWSATGGTLAVKVNSLVPWSHTTRLCAALDHENTVEKVRASHLRVMRRRAAEQRAERERVERATDEQVRTWGEVLP